MRKWVKIVLLAVPALLVAAAGGARLYLSMLERPLPERDAALRLRKDSCETAMALLLGMDSLYRAEIAKALPDADLSLPDTLEGPGRVSAILRQTQALSQEARVRVRSIPSICPLAEGTFNLSARFGVRTDPLEGDDRMHEGLDMACPQGNPVHVTADGVVEFIDSDIFGYGNCIVVNHGYGYQTRYAHLSVIRTSENIRLKRGDVIGETGVSGRATGPHLHYEVLLNGVQQDPEKYMNLNETRR